MTERAGRDQALSRRADAPDVLERFHAELELVEIIGGQVVGAVGTLIDFDDLLSAGREGLLDAAQRFDPERNVPFRAYANIRIRGAMLDAIRRGARLTRRIYEKVAALDASVLVSEGEAECVFSRAPKDESEAESVLIEQLAASAAAFAVDVAMDGGDGELSPSSDPEEAYVRAELSALVHRVIDDLPARDAQLIRLHYLEGQSLREIARSFDAHWSWIVRLHSRAMTRFAARLQRAV